MVAWYCVGILARVVLGLCLPWVGAVVALCWCWPGDRVVLRPWSLPISGIGSVEDRCHYVCS